MRIALAVALAAAAALVADAPAEAGFPVTRSMTCPIGGASFDFETTGSYSTYGARPDGRPFGSWRFPLALPECPDNGLVVYDEFDEAALERLRPLVASDEYQALRRSGETAYYRAYWLMRRTGAPAPHVLWSLVQASWEAEEDPERRRRYLEELVAEGPSLGEPQDLDTVAVRARVVNALRELGRFEEAAAMIEATPLERLTVPSGMVRERDDWRGHYASLAGVIARRDASIEPLDMIPRQVAEQRCLDWADRLDEVQRRICRDWRETRPIPGRAD